MFTRRAAGFMRAHVLCRGPRAGSAFAVQNYGLRSFVGVELSETSSACVPLEMVVASQRARRQ